MFADKMKLYTQILTVLFLFTGLVSCNMFSNVSRRLAAADSIMEQDPDSAYLILNKISGADIVTPEDSAYYGLLYSQARYKLAKKTDTAMLAKSIAFYKKHYNPMLLQRSYFYYGSVLEDNSSDDMRTIMLCYKRAERLIPEVNDTLMTLRIYEALTTSNLNAVIPDASLKYARLELQTAKKYSDKSWIASGLYGMGQAMFLSGAQDSAMYYIQKLEKHAKYETKQARALIYNNIAAYLSSYESPDNSKIEHYIKLSLSCDSLTTSVNMLADLYMRTNREEQAADIYHKMLRSQSSEIRLSAYSSLEDYYFQKNLYVYAYDMRKHYDSLYTIIEDSLRNVNLNELQLKYDNEVIVRTYNATLGKIAICFEFATIMILVVVLIAYRKFHKSKLRFMQYKHMLEQTRHEIVKLKNDNEITLKEKEAKLRKILIEKKMAIQKFERQLSSKDRTYTSELHTLEQSLRYIFHLANEDNFSQYGKKDREAFIEIYRMFEPAYVEELECLSNDLKLTVQEKLYCVFRNMNKNDETIQRMFCWSDDALRKTKSRAINKLKMNKGTYHIVDKIR